MVTVNFSTASFIHFKWKQNLACDYDKCTSFFCCNRFSYSFSLHICKIQKYEKIEGKTINGCDIDREKKL